jgi:hypothetical protein
MKYKLRQGSANAVLRFNDDEGGLNELLARLGLERTKNPSVNSTSIYECADPDDPEDDFGPTRVGRVY